VDAGKLIELWEAQEARRNAVQVSFMSDDPAEKAEAAEAVATLDNRIGAMQEDVWNTYSPKYVRCRDIGHVWDVSVERLDDNGHYIRTLTCYRCETNRVDQVSKLGDLLGRSYQHSPDYLMPRGAGGVRYGKSFWRGLTYLVASKRGQTTH
jgi:hypothetical protein